MELRINLGEKHISSSQKLAISECLESILNNDWDNLLAYASNASNQIKTSQMFRSVNHLHAELALGDESSGPDFTKWDSHISNSRSSSGDALYFFQKTMKHEELDRLSRLHLRNDSVIASLGSCFATNISKYLHSAGFESIFSLRVEEAVASPRTLLSYFCFDEEESNQERFSVRSYNVPELVRQLDLMILTFGVGWDLLDPSGKLITDVSGISKLLRSGCAEFRCDSVEDQKNSIVMVLRQLKRWNPNLTVVTTLSPVPLSGFFSNEFHVTRANTISKASLALAIEAAQREEDFIYLPSYEWITQVRPAVTNSVSFGEDGTTRHPKNSIIAETCNAFIALCRDS